MNPDRRDFLLHLGGIAGTAWISAQWPGMVAAAQHAHQAAAAKQSFEVLTPDQAREVEAIAARIIPTDELPGATEAGVVYFIDHALKTFASDNLPQYQTGLAEVNHLTTQMFPGVKLFSAATAEQQDKILTELSATQLSQTRSRRRNQAPAASGFLQTIWFDTLCGFLIDPEGGGNRDFAGWKVIGRDPAHSFSPPFGYYDKDYPGWQPLPPEAGKK
ncbi:MAG TPA: gluconate 2-dehydrogenase subunit 3 family protein [Candidatus Acidoferrum sp.]|jgi:gluconate 2-dehydrogenase gamma chain